MNIIPDVLSRMQDTNIETEVLDDCAFYTSNIISKNSGNTACRLKVNKEENKQGEIKLSGEIKLEWRYEILQREQVLYEPYREIRDYLKGKRCSVPKRIGLNIDRFVLEDEIVFITAENAYVIPYKRVSLPPNFTKMALIWSHDHETGHGAFL